MIITDLPLNLWLKPIPPFKSVDEFNKLHKCNIKSESGLPVVCRPRLQYGAITLVERPELKDRLNSIPGMGGDWHIYQSVNGFHTNDSEEDYKRIWLYEDQEFVYWYLANCGEKIGLHYFFEEAWNAETPVSKIDISSRTIRIFEYPRGNKSMFEIGSNKPGTMAFRPDLKPDVLYLFTDSLKTAPSHSTKILDRMGEDKRSEHFGWWIPHKDMSVSELVEQCGDAFDTIAIYDKKGVFLENENYPTESRNHQPPIETINNNPEFWKRTDTNKHPAIMYTDSKLKNVVIQEYTINGRIKAIPLHRMGLSSAKPTDNSHQWQILSIIVDTDKRS